VPAAFTGKAPVPVSDDHGWEAAYSFVVDIRERARISMRYGY